MTDYAVSLADVQQLLGQKDLEIFGQERALKARIREQDEVIPRLQAEITEKDRLIAKQVEDIEVLNAMVDTLQKSLQTAVFGPKILHAEFEGEAS